MTVRTRYAPSPTGALHIGNVRSGLFAYLFARHNGGEFILRIDDTDQERSTEESLEEILESLRWLGMEWDKGPPDRHYFQSSRFDRYREGALQLLRERKAYPCYCTAEELDAKRKQAEREHRKPGYDGKCRDLPFPADLALPDKRAGRNYTIRFRSPRTGETVVDDLIKGRAVFDNAELDDLIIFRSDGVPTYNFATVLDDADFAITHVVRGDDHLPNTPRQMQIFFALGLTPPAYAHLPMVMGPDGQKLSKRHGATSVFAYREAGYFPEALLNYLARSGMVARRPGDLFQTGADRVFRFRRLRQVGGNFQRRETFVAEFSLHEGAAIAATRARGAPVHRARWIYANPRR